MSVATAHGEMVVRGALPEDVLEPGASTGVRVQRYVAFAEARKVAEGELV